MSCSRIQDSGSTSLLGPELRIGVYMYNIKDYQLCSTAKKQTKLQRECRWIRVRRILQNSISLGTRVALDFRQALRSHQFPLILRSPPGTNSFSSWIDAASGIYLSIALKIRLRWPMGETMPCSVLYTFLSPYPFANQESAHLWKGLE